MPSILATDTISKHGKRESKRNRYHVDEETQELSPFKSVALQTSETKKWGRFLIKRAGGRLGAARSAQRRNIRTARMSKIRDNIRKKNSGARS